MLVAFSSLSELSELLESCFSGGWFSDKSLSIVLVQKNKQMKGQGVEGVSRRKKVKERDVH
jgi:hypothetical protein